jgi:predicted transcriptional regulator
LETKGFVVHEAFGKSHRYIPKVQKEDYKKVVAGKLLNGYFDNSPKRMLSFFLEENKLDIKELNDILDLINKNK